MAIARVDSYSAHIDDIRREPHEDIAMTKHAETFFFLLATVAALALPAVPAVQEALNRDYVTVEAALPVILMERVEIVASPAHPSPMQVAEVR
ncbi:MAG: hypothetical protein ACM3O5_09355 [Betaproteobacteria bacterium]